MTSQSFIPLTDLERDALAELSNISMARAASSLRQMIKNEVLLAVPSVEILTSAAASDFRRKTRQRETGCSAAGFRWGLLWSGAADLS